MGREVRYVAQEIPPYLNMRKGKISSSCNNKKKVVNTEDVRKIIQVIKYVQKT